MCMWFLARSACVRIGWPHVDARRKQLQEQVEAQRWQHILEIKPQLGRGDGMAVGVSCGEGKKTTESLGAVAVDWPGDEGDDSSKAPCHYKNPCKDEQRAE